MSLHSSPASRSSGFSLLEVLAALVLLALLLTGVYAGVHSSILLVRRGDAAVQRQDQIRLAQVFLRRELAQAMPVPIRRNAQGQPVYFIGNATEMHYVAALPGYLGKQGLQVQTLRLVGEKKADLRLEASFHTWLPDGRPSRALGDPQVLVDHLRSGRFSYRGRIANGQPAIWQPQWRIDQRLPQQVQIELDPGRGAAWPRLEVPLRLNAAVSNRQGAGDLLRRFNGGDSP